MPYRDPEKKRAANVAWRAAHPEYNWHRDNSEKSRAQSGAYRRDNLEQYAQYQRNSRKRNPRGHLVTEAKSRAKQFGLPFDISVDDINWVTHCPVLGVELVYGRSGGDGHRYNSASLDRRINDLGYVKGNVFVISHRANRMKQDASPEELAALAAYAIRVLPTA